MMHTISAICATSLERLPNASLDGLETYRVCAFEQIPWDAVMRKMSSELYVAILEDKPISPYHMQVQ